MYSVYLCKIIQLYSVIILPFQFFESKLILVFQNADFIVYGTLPDINYFRLHCNNSEHDMGNSYK